jgi:hypothetical protein
MALLRTAQLTFWSFLRFSPALAINTPRNPTHDPRLDEKNDDDETGRETRHGWLTVVLALGSSPGGG